MDLADDNERHQRSRSGTVSPNNASAAANSTKEKSTALVREEIRRAILRHVAGDSEAYDRIKEVFTADPKNLGKDGSPMNELPTPTTLRNHLLGLLANVSALDSNCNGLVHAVLSSEWVGRDESYVKLFVKFLGTLAAARGVYQQSVLRMLVGNLRHGEFSICHDLLSISSGFLMLTILQSLTQSENCRITP
jgi:RNA polymerase I-specific transcription initiation factor RRN3